MTEPLTFAINLAPVTRRWLTVAILSMTFLMAIALILSVASLFEARRGEIEELRHELGRVKSLVERGRDLRQEAEKRDRSIDALFLAGADEAAAASTLQTLVTAAARESGLEVISSGRAPSFIIEGLTMIGVRIDVSGDMPAVYNYLDRLFHRLRNADMRKVAVWRSANGTTTVDKVAMVAQIEVFGALPRGAASTSAPRR
ncbi:type II secretion system protein GspM [Aquibium sp. ELW1220]|uniref:type II secretion system protein GspM n=1 Tax=Aquibium sp. ELW1220 TaxID=2976766 RepID=UPI0025B0D47B|nr:type II secretion system protein GspM [Aquibium sp. ELW1220]MDN2581686.1 type II secretion system protein GspM [Aquibium sp. ELW1220]